MPRNSQLPCETVNVAQEHTGGTAVDSEPLPKRIACWANCAHKSAEHTETMKRKNSSRAILESEDITFLDLDAAAFLGYQVWIRLG